jgi:hypothetical protein
MALMRLKSTIPVLCNQCIKKEQLISAINIIASNKESALSKYSTNMIF